MTDPRIASLVGAAEDAADDWSPNRRVETGVDRAGPWATVLVGGMCKEHVVCPVGTDINVTARLDVEQLEELIRDLLAVRADLLKLTGGK